MKLGPWGLFLNPSGRFNRSVYSVPLNQNYDFVIAPIHLLNMIKATSKEKTTTIIQ